MIGDRSAAVKAFWETFKAETGCEACRYHARTFSDPRFTPVTDEIAELARIGQKRGTAHLSMDFDISDIPRRNVGEYLVVLNSKNEPQCVVRCTKMAVVPYAEVTEEFAESEGERDLTLRSWREGHGRYFAKQCDFWGLTFDESMPVVCESFELLWPKP